MQEAPTQTTTQDPRLALCIHHIYAMSCIYCRHKAAPRHSISSYGRTTSAQFTAIVNLAQAKQRSLPANIRTWSVSFASKYIRFLLELPFPREVLPRLEQFNKEHNTMTDSFKASHAKPREYYWADGMTKPITLSIVDGDTQDLVDGVVKEMSND